MGQNNGGSFFLYLGLLLGVGILAIYFWVVINDFTIDIIYRLTHFLTGILLTASALGFAGAKTRSGRVSLTMASGIFGGVHSYLDIMLFPDFMGILMFALMAIGMLLTFACFVWLYE